MITLKITTAGLLLALGFQTGYGMDEKPDANHQQTHQSAQQIHEPSVQTNGNTGTEAKHPQSDALRSYKEPARELWGNLRNFMAQESTYFGIKSYRGSAYGLMGIVGGAFLLFVTPNFITHKYKYGMMSLGAGCLCMALSPTKNRLLRYGAPTLGKSLAVGGTVVACAPFVVLLSGFAVFIYGVSNAGGSVEE